MAFTAAQRLTIRQWVGSATPPEDGEFDVVADDLGTTDPLVVARHYLAVALADRVAAPSSFSLAGDYTADHGANVEVLRDRLAELDALIDTAAPIPGAPTLVAGTMTRDDRDRLWSTADY